MQPDHVRRGHYPPGPLKAQSNKDRLYAQLSKKAQNAPAFLLAHSESMQMRNTGQFNMGATEEAPQDISATKSGDDVSSKSSYSVVSAGGKKKKKKKKKRRITESQSAQALKKQYPIDTSPEHRDQLIPFDKVLRALQAVDFTKNGLI
jgi:hypothetical protein